MVELSRCAAGLAALLSAIAAPNDARPNSGLDEQACIGNTGFTTRETGALKGHCAATVTERCFHKSLVPKGRQKSNLHIVLPHQFGLHRARSTITSFEAPRDYTLVELRILRALRSKLPSGLGA